MTESHTAHSGADTHVKRSRIDSGSLFARWFWLVYVPLGLFAGLLVLAITGLLPLRGVAALMVMSLWAAIAIRLLAERIRIGLEVPLPGHLVAGITWIVGLGTTGGVFIWIGISKLTSEQGMILALAGVFFIVFAALLPLMKAADWIVRGLTRLPVRLFVRRPAKSTARPEVSQRQGVVSRVVIPPVRHEIRVTRGRTIRVEEPPEEEEIRVTSAASRG